MFLLAIFVVSIWLLTLLGVGELRADMQRVLSEQQAAANEAGMNAPVPSVRPSASAEAAR